MNMKTKEIIFFATKIDISDILQEVESTMDLFYLQCGLTDNNKIEKIRSYLHITNLGVTSYPDWMQGLCYLVFPIEVDPTIRPVNQIDGSIKYFTDQMLNRDCVELRPNGLYHNEAVIAGRLATLSDSVLSIRLFGLFTQIIKKRFVKIGICYVGQGAETLMQKGVRLTRFVNSPKQFDLNILSKNAK